MFDQSQAKFTKTGPWGADFSLSHKIEAVGFPFIPKHDISNPAIRRLILPEMSSYINDVNNLTFNQNIGFGTINFSNAGAWRGFDNYDDDQFLFRSFREELNGEANKLRRYILCDINNNQYVSFNRFSTLISDYFNSSSLGDPDIYRLDARIYYPHTALKHTIYLHCGSPGTSLKENIIDSISFVIDHTWVNDKFPWYNQNYNDASNAALHDFELASFMFESIPYSVDEGSLYVGGNEGLFFDFPVSQSSNVEKILDYIDIEHFVVNNTGSFSTINYYPFLGVQNDCQSIKSEPIQNYNAQQGILNFDPYNFYRTASNSLHIYAGSFDKIKNPHALNGIVHEYEIDKPIDLTIFSPYDKVIYNPSSVDINLNGTLILPSGYTFKTARKIEYGTQHHFPRYMEVLADKLHMEQNFGKTYAQLTDVPVRANQIAEYHIKAGSTLFIEDCVEMYDAEIIIEPGATVSYNSENFIFREVDFTGDLSGLVDRSTSMTCQERNTTACYFDYPNGLNITENTVWAGKHLKISGTLNISAGKSLTLNACTLEFADNQAINAYSGIKVGSNAILNASNTVFQGLEECPSFWNGIEVSGRKPESESNSSPDNGGSTTFLPPGEAILSQCTIKHAEVGVLAPTNAGELGGAKLQIQNSDFRENRIDIRIEPDNQISTNLVSACTFSNNYWQRHPLSKVSNIELEGVNGVNINNSTFENGFSGQSTAIIPPVVGIKAIASSFNLTGSNFIANHIGVECQNSGNVYITGNDFDLCKESMIISSIGFLQLNGNHIFTNKNNLNYQHGYFQGNQITLQDIETLIIKNNEFDKVFTSEDITAISLMNDIAVGTSIYENDFNGFETALYVNGSGGMDIYCNTFFNYDVGISLENTIFSTLSSPSGVARNRFVAPFKPGRTDIFVDPNSTFITYLYSEENTQIPLVYSSASIELQNVPEASADCPGSDTPIYDDDEDL